MPITALRSRPVAIVLALVLLAVAALGAAWALRASEPEPAGDAAIRAQIDAAGFTDAQKDAIGLVARQYILDHPEILPEAIERLQQKQAAEQLSEAGKGLAKPFPGAFLGNPEGEKVLVEFSDYACGYCRQSVGEVKALISADPDLKVVIREFPILSQASVTAAHMALAAAEQGKYAQFHDAMYAAGRPSEESIAAAAKAAGLDMARARKVAESEAVANEIEANRQFAAKLQIEGTPAWIAGDKVMQGAVGQSALRTALYPDKR